MTKNEKYIVDMYVRYFGRAADAATIATYAEDKKTSVILKNIIADADAEKAELSTSDFVNNAFQNLFGRNAKTKEMNKYSKVVDKGKDLPINAIVKSAAKTDKAVYDNKKAVALKYAELGGTEQLDLSKISKGNLIDIKTVTTLADLQAKIDALPENSNVPSAFDGKTYDLTIGVDTLTGTNKDDTFLATSSSTQWTVADSIDGGKGVDTLKLIDAGNITLTLPAAATVKNVEILDVIGGAAVTANTTSIDGVTHLYTTSTGANTSTAAATTNINATATGAAVAAEAIAVNGGKDVTVVSKNNIADTIAVGATTTAAGKVSVTSTGGTANGDTAGAINVTGGTTVTVNQYAGNAALTGNNTTGGTITVTGNASTTTVTVNQTATATGANATATTAGVVGYTAGAVTVDDKNTASTTLADTIETVTVKNAGVVTIDSGALKTLNLEGTITSVTASDATVKTGITAVDTLALNLKGVTTAAITADADVKTLNIASSKDASTVTTLTSAGATAINISGDAALTVTTLTAGAANKVITVTNTAGVTIGNALATDVTFTGGAGADSVILSASYTKAINMGAGNDTVVYAAAGAGGSLNGGDGNDTLVVSADSAIAGLPEVSGFEILRAKGGTSATHNAHTFKALEVGTNTTATTFTNVAAGVGLTVLEANTGVTTTVTLANATGTADVFDLTLKSAASLTAGTVALAGVETVNINSVDTDTTAVNANTLTLTATSAKSVVVTGDTGIILTAGTSVNVTSFDASALKGAVTFTSTNDTAFANVTIKGATGNFINTLTGGDANDTIIGGSAADILDGGDGFNTLTGGAGADTFTVSAQNVSTGMDKITDFVGGVDKIKIGTAADAFTDLRTTDFELSGSLTAAATNALTAATATTANDVVLFTYNSKVYAAITKDVNTSFTDGTDILVDITGVTGTVAMTDFIA